MNSLSRLIIIGLSTCAVAASALDDQILSHPPICTLPTAPDRPMAKGPALFVDAVGGDDANDGSEKAPWKTVNFAMTRLGPGDTLYLREGTYYEHVYCAVAGTEKAPITIRAYPKEMVVIDGGFREFSEEPETAWEPVPSGAPGEFRSTRRYANIRDVFGSFGDSMVGMSTYYHAVDLRAENELWSWKDWDKKDETDCEPLYCGPGLWYDRQTGLIHVRLVHTTLPGVPNYEGETDPRKIPLIIAPFRSVPLLIDHARHLRIQDIVFRGAGYDCLVLDYAQNLELDNCTVWCGSYGITASRTGPMKAYRCGFYGNVPPWLARSDTSKRAYPGRPHRDITRLNTHAHWVIDNGREFSVFATPVNDDWEVAYCEFIGGHDGPYFGGVGVRFHHNLVHNTQDDGIYLSQMYPRHLYGRSGAEIHIYQNVFSKVLTALAFGGMDDTRDKIFIYRNIFDLREPVYTGRPSTKNPEPHFSTGKVMGDHGSPPWPEMTFYHNTFAVTTSGRFAMGLFGAVSQERPRKVFNNILYSFSNLTIPAMPTKGESDVAADANLYWAPGADPVQGKAILAKTRREGLDVNAVIADPQFMAAMGTADAPNDYRLRAGSVAVDSGAALPAEWPDPCKSQDKGKPDIGALPLGAEMLMVGRTAVKR